VQVGLGARVGHAHAGEAEARAEEGGVALLVRGGGAEGEADGREGGGDGGVDGGVRVAEQAGRELAD
jgi:hypothetical protein